MISDKLPRLRHFTLEDRQLIEKYIQAGFTIAEIAKALNRSYESISREVKKCGGKRLYSADESHNKYLNNMKYVGVVRPFSDDEKRAIQRLISEGKSYERIAKILGRTFNSISTEVCKGGGRNNYAPILSDQKESEKVFTLEEQFQRLRFQVEILADQVKILNNKIEGDYDRKNNKL